MNLVATAENSQELIVEFVEEAIDSLREVPAQLEAHARMPEDDGPINAVFRAVHSIKGCAGFLGLTAVKQFSHALENTMDEVRKGKLALEANLLRALIGGIDLLEVMLDRTLNGHIDTELNDEESALLAEVERVAAACAAAPPSDNVLDQLAALADEINQSDHPAAAAWASRCRAILVKLGGTVDEESCEEEAAARSAPTPRDFAQAKCRHRGEDATQHLQNVLHMFLETESRGFRTELAAPFAEAVEAFAAWADGIQDTALAAALRAAAADFQILVNSPLDIDAGLLSVVWDRLWPEFVRFEGAPTDSSSGSISVEEKSGDDSSTATAASNKPKDKDDEKSSADATNAKKSRLVRVKEERLDGFLNEVSRLFITNELLKDLQSRMSAERAMPALVEELRQINAAFNAQSAALQRNVVSLRRVSVSGLFSKFPRMARTLAGQLGKKIDVRLLGEETEIDKSLVEDLDAPLTHMIRNSIDHGLELPAERLAAGKPECGTLTLSAELTRTHVVISIEDDGRGIDPNRLRRKAVEKQLLTPEQAQALNDEEAIKLIFAAGFSTAEQLSEVSGRGVGMDVVRANLEEHNGEIRVQSKIGVGTQFRLEIPIRDAVLVIDGLMIEQSGDRFVLPFEHIREITEIAPAELKPVQGSRVATVRGNSVAAVSLAEVLGLANTHERTPHEPRPAVLVGCKYGEICLLVDRVRGHRQIVLNSLKEILPGTSKLAGVAQLGGGQLALVLSVEDIVRSLRLAADDRAKRQGTVPAQSLQPA